MNDKEKKIFFSIIVCCYNSEKFIKETLNSIINQSYRNYELILINDGSNDRTEQIIHEYLNKKIEIKYHKFKSNQGFAKARNKAVSLSKHNWIVIIDHDDLIISERLEIQSSEIKKNLNCGLFFGNVEYFDKINNKYSKFESFKKENKFDLNILNFSKNIITNHLVRYGCFIVSSSVIFNKNLFNAVGGFNENQNFVADYDFFLKLSYLTDFYCSKKILCKWRKHVDQASSKNIKKHQKELIIILIKYLFKSKINLKVRIFTIIKIFYYILKFILT